MPHAYTEDQLCEQPAIGLFAEIGWQTVSASEEIFGKDGTLGRETPSEVVLESRLQAALERLNPALPPEAVTAPIDELTRDRSAMSLEASNREVPLLLQKGIAPSMTPQPLTLQRRIPNGYWVEYGHERKKLRRKYDRRLAT